MKSLQERTAAGNSLLSPYAVPIQGTLGRAIAEPDDETRFPFQRDRDRIIHTQAFRRLKGKTQVFVEGKGDHYRTRLTHTMEVSQIGRDIARTLGLNEDLTECIALAHDLGHPPFGHAGEAALDAWMQEGGSGFEHNAQSLRIVTVLAEHSSQFPGLNLNEEVLDGLRKHADRKREGDRGMSLEAQVVNIADEIAYTGHDCDDGLRAELFSMKDLSVVPIVAEALEHSRARGTDLRGALIHVLVSDLYQATEQKLKTMKIQTLDDVYAYTSSLVRFSEEKRVAFDALRSFLQTHMYGHPRVVEASKRGQTIIVQLCTKLLETPSEKVLALQKRTVSTLLESVKDYVSGMTDAYAKAML